MSVSGRGRDPYRISQYELFYSIVQTPDRNETYRVRKALPKTIIKISNNTEII